MKDDLGNRIKDNYENRTRSYLPRRTNTIIRVDGKAFHTYTRGCKRPFDDGLMEDMNSTAISLCEKIQGAKMAYVQSDEISIFLTDYDDMTTSAWFDGNIQKICSISASIATAKFNESRIKRLFKEIKYSYSASYDITIEDFLKESANFDSRVFVIPDVLEVANYFKWRSDDASRNSVQMVARSLYSHQELEGKGTSTLKEMIIEKGSDWNKFIPCPVRSSDIKLSFHNSVKRISFKKCFW